MFNDNDSSYAGTTMLETSFTATIPQEPETIPAASMGPKIAANMAGVRVTVRRPGGKYKIKNASVMAADEHGKQETIEGKKITKPGFITDTKADHPIWERIDDNTKKFTSLLKTYSVPECLKASDAGEDDDEGLSTGSKGFYLVPMGVTGNLTQELFKLKEERKHLAEELKNDYDTWIANLRAKFNGQFHLLLPALPRRESLRRKFAVSWGFQPLTPIDPASMKFSDINDHDRQQIIADSNKMAQELIQQRARAIYDEAFGSVLDSCDKIVAGSLETGKRKFAAITEIIESLNRLKNFSEWANPEVVARADDALKVLTGISDISEINQNEGQNQVTRAIVAAMKPLGDSVDRMLRTALPGSGRANREIMD